MDENANFRSDQEKNNNVKKVKVKKKSHVTELQSILGLSVLKKREEELQNPGKSTHRMQELPFSFNFKSYVKNSMLSLHKTPGKYYTVNSLATRASMNYNDPEITEGETVDDDQGGEATEQSNPNPSDADSRNASSQRADDDNKNENNNMSSNNNNDEKRRNSSSGSSSSSTQTYKEASERSSSSSSIHSSLDRPKLRDRNARRNTLATNLGEIDANQLYVTDSVGRAGIKTRGYVFSTYGEYTRNPAQIKLKDIQRLGNCDNEKIDRIVRVLKIAAIIMMVVVRVSGILLFLFMMVLSMNPSFVDFLRSYLLDNRLMFIFILGGIIQPFAIGMYSFFAILKLNHIRPYFLRIPFALMFPLGFLILSVKFTSGVTEKSEHYLHDYMNHYQSSSHIRYVWDDLQSNFECCGVKLSSEWRTHFNITGHPSYPKSCCINPDDLGCPSFSLPSSVHSHGCLRYLRKLNTAFGILFIIISLTQFGLEMGSVVFVKMLFDIIKYEMDDSRSNCKIILGKCYSICDSVEYDRQQELAEQNQVQLQDIAVLLPKITYESQTNNSVIT